MRDSVRITDRSTAPRTSVVPTGAPAARRAPGSNRRGYPPANGWPTDAKGYRESGAVPAHNRTADREAQAVFGFQYGIVRPAGYPVGGDAPPDEALPLPPDGDVDDARHEGKLSFCNSVVELFHPLSQHRAGVTIMGRQHEAPDVLVRCGSPDGSRRF
jgi:hypothetical protein